VLEDDSLPLYVMKNAILITRYLLIITRSFVNKAKEGGHVRMSK
jgi:hypothetical protein